MKYTITFDKEHEQKFRGILERLDPSEYTLVEDVRLADHKPGEDPRYVPRQAIVDLDPEACLTFRLSMRNVKIRRERTEEELSEEQALKDANTITIKVIVPKDDATPATP